MKRIILSLTLILLTVLSQAHTIINGCWTNGVYSVNATQGSADGKVEVTVYSNSNMTTVIQATRTFFLNPTSVSFTVNQPIRTTSVYVVVKWFKRNGNSNNYLEDIWNNGSSISTNQTGTNSCNVLAFAFKDVQVTKIQYGVYRIVFVVEDESNIDKYIIKISEDGKTFKEKTIIFSDSQLHKGTYSVTIKL